MGLVSGIWCVLTKPFWLNRGGVLLMYDDSLVARMIKARYFRRYTFHEAGLCSNPSYMYLEEYFCGVENCYKKETDGLCVVVLILRFILITGYIGLLLYVLYHLDGCLLIRVWRG